MRSKAAALVLAAGALGWSATRAEPPAAPASAAAGAQAVYDAAQTAFDRGDWNGAITGFERLLPADAQAPLTGSKAVIAGRLARALLQVGRYAESRAAAERAAAGLPPGSVDQDEARLAAAEAAVNTYDLRGAAALYRQARDGSAARGDAPAELKARVGLGTALITVDPVGAGAEFEAVLATPKLEAAVGRPTLAVIQDLRGRAATNAGDAAVGQRWVDRAIAATGGLAVARFNVAQATMRTDAAIASSLRHDDEDTRKYLTYSGAGHLKSLDWVGEFEGDLPVCGDAAVEPQDKVVVQIALDPLGAVTSVRPLWASRSGDLAALFARSVAGWRWRPEAITALDPFTRSTLALELSCESRPKPDGLEGDTVAALDAWLAAHGVRGFREGASTFVAADDTRLSRQDLSAAPALLGRVASGGTSAARLAAILDAGGAPVSAYALLLRQQARAAAAGATGRRVAARRRAEVLVQGLPRLESRFGDDAALEWLRLEAALAWEDAGAFADAGPLLDRVLRTPESVLPADAAVRRVALLHAAIVGRFAGGAAAAAAEARLAASGFGAQQCLLFDTHPIATSLSSASFMFPQDAQRWRFEGYVRTAFDIADDGRTAHPRAIVAYPPFVFAKSSEEGVGGFRYAPPRLGGSAVGCTGQTTNIRFRMPAS